MNLSSFFLRPLLRAWTRGTKRRSEGAPVIPGLREQVKVLWGPCRVPHVFAQNERDLLVAQGYLHARERLWQMDFNRRFFCGQLAEVFGERSLPWRGLSIHFRDKTIADLDFFVRLIGIRRSARASLAILPEAFMDRLEAYSQGVNRYIETHLKSLPLEFRLLRYQPEPWRPEDILTLGKGFALQLSTSLPTRLAMSAISTRLRGQEAKLKALFPIYPDGEPTIARHVPDPGSQAVREILRFLNGTFQASGWGAGGQGSNNWVVAPFRSATGAAILCNDPHLRMTLPPVWYLMHLKAAGDAADPQGFESWGASVPGLPFIQLGHNRRIAWGVTAALCDDADLYREKIHPVEPDLYRVGAEWKKMGREKETIRIRGGKKIEKSVRFTRHGPLLSDFTGAPASQEALAFRWTAHEASAEFRAVYEVNRARDWGEFLSSLSHQGAPTLNYVYADVEGNIGYALAGRIPARPASSPVLPVPGWTEEFEWRGYIPFSEHPRLYNPPEGFIATANNRIVDRSYPYHLPDLFEPPYRIRRIRELLSAKEKFSLYEMARIQNDVVSLHALDTIAAIQRDLREIARDRPPLRQAVEMLTAWDGACSTDSPAAALFHAFYHCLAGNLLEPELGPDLAIAYTEIFNHCLAPLDRILRDPVSPWFARAPRKALLEKSLLAALSDLTRRLRSPMEEWRWGRLHSMTLRHPLGLGSLLGPILSRGPFPSPGDGATVNTGFFNHSHPYEHVVGASLRMVLDLDRWDHSTFIVAGGQSGDPFSPHYDDQAEPWRRGNAIQLYYEEKAMKDWPVLLLAPRSAE